ncbi:hypothetical protein Y032_0158g3234 [Ancylostoma ceylanicum]|uniref:Uncharacterized protein n=1 Tax=Ancylostoma ceylanicum TaxID=53326 RepID=A0A016SXX4_9BILA|nr:hypothetical protein Y032_0158g3234 [Ancylostoma ceylanicum]
MLQHAPPMEYLPWRNRLPRTFFIQSRTARPMYICRGIALTTSMRQKSKKKRTKKENSPTPVAISPTCSTILEESFSVIDKENFANSIYFSNGSNYNAVEAITIAACILSALHLSAL